MRNPKAPKKNFLLEVLERPFLSRNDDKEIELTSQPDRENIEVELDAVVPTGFFDNGESNIYSGQTSKKHKQTHLQNELIRSYRKLANTAEVMDAVNEIVDEAIFTPGDKEILSMDFDDDIPQEVKDKFASELKNIMKKMKLQKNIYTMFMQFYIDGQLNVHCAYDANDLGAGIKKLSILSPFGLNYNYTKEKWEYSDTIHGSTQFATSREKKSRVFDKEEIIRIDSGIYSDDMILSNLHTAIKPANMLSTLEDMLIPMRFSRSVSRRVFNVDVSNLNNKKAEEVMKKNQAKFKYKKFYDLKTGTIANQQHISSLTEDYWFPNRGGEKGTTVDTLDETGNLGELDDILYFKRKLYTTLKVPTNRINDAEPGQAEFSFDDSSISREELKFFNFITRIRNQFLELFYELLRREIITKGMATDEEWYELLNKFSIKFVSENKFFEKMEREHINENLSLYSNIEEMIGKYFSYSYTFKKVLHFTDEEIKAMSEQIENEKNDPLYARFYSDEDDGDDW